MLETERLIIRRFTPQDLEKMIALRSDDEVIKYLGGRRLQNPEAIAKRFEFYIDCYQRFGYGMCAMIWRETSEMIGWSGLQPLEDSEDTEVGYGMIKEFWGRGIGFEAARAWLEYGFRVVDLKSIVAVASPENTGSWRIMEKLGMRREKTETHYGMECVFYRIDEEDFERA